MHLAFPSALYITVRTSFSECYVWYIQLYNKFSLLLEPSINWLYFYFSPTFIISTHHALSIFNSDNVLIFHFTRLARCPLDFAQIFLLIWQVFFIVYSLCISQDLNSSSRKQLSLMRLLLWLSLLSASSVSFKFLVYWSLSQYE